MYDIESMDVDFTPRRVRMSSPPPGSTALGTKMVSLSGLLQMTGDEMRATQVDKSHVLARLDRVASLLGVLQRETFILYGE